MPYTSEIRVSADSGTAPSFTANITLWEMWRGYDNAGRGFNNQVDQESISVNVAGGTPVAFSTMDGPNYLTRSHDIGLAVYQDNSPGPMFRSGRLGDLPTGSPADPAGLVDVMALTAQRFTIAEINAMIPLPITLDDGTTVTSAAVASAPPSRNLTLTAGGPYGATTFAYTMTFTIDPSNDQFDLTNVLEANPVGPRGGATLTFTAGPGGGLQALIDNVFAGLFVGGITNQVLRRITDSLNTTAATAAANAAAARGFSGGIPPGVVLGVRSVGVASNGDIVMSPALGAFGSIISRFIAAAPPSGTGRGPCPILMVATMAQATELLPLLRAIRDGQLARTRTGRELIELYYTHAEEVAEILDRDAGLLARAKELAATANNTLSAGATAELRDLASRLAKDIAQSGSPTLRTGVRRALWIARVDSVMT